MTRSEVRVLSAPRIVVKNATLKTASVLEQLLLFEFDVDLGIPDLVVNPAQHSRLTKNSLKEVGSVITRFSVCWPRSEQTSRATASHTTDCRARGESMPTPPKQLTLQLRVELGEVTPTVWRQILVPTSVRLSRLHDMLQAAMGWTNSHLHAYNVGDARYGMCFDEYPEGEIDEQTVTVL